jgi:uncharacterized Tic20 family protein
MSLELLPSADDTDGQPSSLLGVLIHPIAFVGLFGVGFLAAGVVYALADQPFTKSNARNAVNWHLSVFGLTVVSGAMFVLGRTEIVGGSETVGLAVLPSPLDGLFGFVGLLFAVVTLVAGFLSIVFAIVATMNALAGNAWPYPFVPEIVGRDG